MVRENSTLKKIGAFIFPILIIVGLGGLAITTSIEDKPEIGVIHITDTIQNFEYAEIIDEARDDPDIEAVVVRFNSPGGGVDPTFQTELSLRELAAEKPVIAELNEFAASGAYIIASAADEIYSHEFTLTGGLAVRSEWISYGEFLDNLGINIYQWETGDQKNLYDPLREPTENDIAYIDNMIETLGEEILTIIQNNRPEVPIENEAIQSGRVLRGYEAYEVNLIDNFLRYKDPIAEARIQAGLEGEEYEIVHLN